MLRYAHHTFEFEMAVVSACKDAILFYAGLLVSKGYFARHHHSVEIDDSGRQITVSGTLCSGEGLDVAGQDKRIIKLLEDIRVITGIHETIRYASVLGSDDDVYALRPPWKKLNLVCDPIFGTSPLRTDDGGIVARYQLPIDDKLASDLWVWDVEYDGIYNCWLASGKCENWAQQELSGSNSNLNKTAKTLARRLSDAIGCPVEYVMHC